MYSQPNSTSIGSRPGGGGKKWPPVATPSGAATNNLPAVAPKPKPFVNGRRPAAAPKPFHSGAQDKPTENIPAWKKELESRRTNASQNDSSVSWKTNQENKLAIDKRVSWTKPKEDEEEGEDVNIPAWKRELMKAKVEAEKSTESKPSWVKRNEEETPRPEPIPSWTKPKPENSNSSSSSSSHDGPQWSKKNVTVPWSEQREDTEAKFAPPPLPNAPKPVVSTKRPPFDMFNKPTIEKSSGSFGGRSSMKSAGESSGNQVTSPQRRVGSFLHTKPIAAPDAVASFRNGFAPPPPRASEKPSIINGMPPRLQVPREKYFEPPPLKTSKPPNVVLPFKGKKKFCLPSFSRPPLSSREFPAPPPAENDLPSPPSISRGLPSPLSSGGRDLMPPPPDSRDLPLPDLPLPPQCSRDLPLPELPPSLPPRTATLEPARPLPSPTPSKIKLPLPSPPADDIYDDAEAEPPPLPPLMKKESLGLIPTWDDEDDGEGPDAIYDETPDECPPALPAGFPTAGSTLQIAEEDEDMYEDVDEYMKLKKRQIEERQRQPANESVSGAEGSRKDKKKKDSEKKEKDIRKKFKLPAEGDIVPEGRGFVKESCKGGRGKALSVSQGEQIEVIRMSDNPKGKWLIRNTQGEYGFVDSDKVQIDVNRLKNFIGSSKRGPSGIGGPNLPPPMIPTEDEGDDAIYDQTADEDIYEEV